MSKAIAAGQGAGNQAEAASSGAESAVPLSSGGLPNRLDPVPAAPDETPEFPEEIREWLWHLELHLTEHDERHAGLALRAGWPPVRDYFYARLRALTAAIESSDFGLTDEVLDGIEDDALEAANTFHAFDQGEYFAAFRAGILDVVRENLRGMK